MIRYVFYCGLAPNINLASLSVLFVDNSRLSVYWTRVKQHYLNMKLYLQSYINNQQAHFTFLETNFLKSENKSIPKSENKL